jgi:ankyrin repeat protein
MKETMKEKELLDAVYDGDTKGVQAALASGADANTQNSDGMTSLMLASRYGYSDIVDLLLRYGADVNARDKDGTTALMFASEWVKEDGRDDFVKIVTLLLDHGAGINVKNRNGNTALILASTASTAGTTIDVVKLLLDRGADVHIKNNDSYTALRLVEAESLYREIRNDHLYRETISLLKAYGAV